MKKFFGFIPLLVVLLILVLLGWKLSYSTNEPLPGTHPAPEISLPSVLNPGETLDNGDFNAKVNIINIFASWCTPCVAELPMLEEMAGLPGVKIYGIAWHDKDDKLKAWLAKHTPPFAEIGSDQEGKAAIALGIRGVPESFFIDDKGNILHHHAGIITREDMDKTLLPLIKKYTQ